MSPLKVFVSYAHENVEYKNDLKKHCSLFEEENEIELWIDDDIRAGDKFDDRIKEEVLKADIAILLLSSTYWSKEYIKDTELLFSPNGGQGPYEYFWDGVSATQTITVISDTTTISFLLLMQ